MINFSKVHLTNDSLESRVEISRVPTVGMARHPRFLFHGRSGREDFRSASLSSADERAQFPRVGRRGKKLERSTRVCRLRRPCTSDRSGQCQRCRSPPPPKSKSSSPPPPSNLCRGSSNRRAKTRAESA